MALRGQCKDCYSEQALALNWQTVARISSVASIVGATVSIWVLVTVSLIRAHYVAKGRIPKLRSTLSKHASDLVTSLADYPDSRHDVNAVVARIDGVIGSIGRKRVPKNVKRALRDVRKNIKDLKRARRQGTTLDVDVYYRLYARTQGLFEALRQLEEDLKWEG